MVSVVEAYFSWEKKTLEIIFSSLYTAMLNVTASRRLRIVVVHTRTNTHTRTFREIDSWTCMTKHNHTNTIKTMENLIHFTMKKSFSKKFVNKCNKLDVIAVYVYKCYFTTLTKATTAFSFVFKQKYLNLVFVLFCVAVIFYDHQKKNSRWVTSSNGRSYANKLNENINKALFCKYVTHFRKKNSTLLVSRVWSSKYNNNYKKMYRFFTSDILIRSLIWTDKKECTFILLSGDFRVEKKHVVISSYNKHITL